VIIATLFSILVLCVTKAITGSIEDIFETSGNVKSLIRQYAGD